MPIRATGSSFSQEAHMFKFKRREFLSFGCALILALAVSCKGGDAFAKLTPPPLPETLPEAWTKAEVIPLWPGQPPGNGSYTSRTRPVEMTQDPSPVLLHDIMMPELHVFRPERPNGLAVLVIPGGAYIILAITVEGVEIAERLNPLGITVFVLTHRLPDEGWGVRADVPLQDAQRAMRVIRSQASRFAINPETVSVMGFSAGGHLAGTLTTGFAEKVYAPVDEADKLSARPFASALIYPVVTMMKPWTHELSRKLLLGDAPPDAEVARRSVELHVDGDTPPVFIVHSMDDDAVPIENTLRMIDAIRKAHRPVEAHLFEEGGHGFGAGYSGTTSGKWIDLFDTWLHRQRIKAGLEK
jgi:acetyl esterase/lipase